MSDHLERLEACLDAHRPDEARKSGDVIATFPNPEGRGWQHLTGADLRAAVAELKQLRDEVVLLRHDAKRCTAVYDHRLYGRHRCEMPIHGRKGHHAGLPGGWVQWDDDASQQPERGGEANCNPECREAHAGQPH